MILFCFLLELCGILVFDCDFCWGWLFYVDCCLLGLCWVVMLLFWILVYLVYVFVVSLISLVGLRLVFWFCYAGCAIIRYVLFRSELRTGCVFDFCLLESGLIGLGWFGCWVCCCLRGFACLGLLFVYFFAFYLFGF